MSHIRSLHSVFFLWCLFLSFFFFLLALVCHPSPLLLLLLLALRTGQDGQADRDRRGALPPSSSASSSAPRRITPRLLFFFPSHFSFLCSFDSLLLIIIFIRPPTPLHSSISLICSSPPLLPLPISPTKAPLLLVSFYGRVVIYGTLLCNIHLPKRLPAPGPCP